MKVHNSDNSESFISKLVFIENPEALSDFIFVCTYKLSDLLFNKFSIIKLIPFVVFGFLHL